MDLIDRLQSISDRIIKLKSQLETEEATGTPTIIIECQHWKETLDPHNSQLFRYFHVTAAKFAILANGILYRFYRDLEDSNKMAIEKLEYIDDHADDLIASARGYDGEG